MGQSLPIFIPSFSNNSPDISSHFLTNPDEITEDKINMKPSENMRLQMGLEAYQSFRRAAFLFSATDCKT